MARVSIALGTQTSNLRCRTSKTNSKSIRRSRDRSQACHARWSHRPDWGEGGAQVPEKVITLLTPDGLITFSSGSDPDAAALRKRQLRLKRQPPLPTWEEQGLCLAATFTMTASNGRDTSRRVQLLGFCRSVDMLSEAVEDTVLSHGGEIWQREVTGLEQRLVMSVALPLLWGLPPTYDSLSSAISHGGGIIHKVSKQWLL